MTFARNAAHASIVGVAAIALALGGCKKVPDQNGDGGAAVAGEAETGETIAAAVASDGNLSRTEDLLSAADLATTLEGPGPYTLFAPSDAALGALPDDVVDTLEKEDAKPQLTSLLTGHIVPGTVTAADIAKAVQAGGGKTELKTMAGDVLTFAGTDGALTVSAPGGEPVRLAGDAHQASNGIVHVIDGVLIRN